MYVGQTSKLPTTSKQFPQGSISGLPTAFQQLPMQSPKENQVIQHPRFTEQAAGSLPAASLLPCMHFRQHPMQLSNTHTQKPDSITMSFQLQHCDTPVAAQRHTCNFEINDAILGRLARQASFQQFPSSFPRVTQQPSSSLPAIRNAATHCNLIFQQQHSTEQSASSVPIAFL